ncbi:hypothetical protein [Methanocaldococcus sp.]
MYVVNNPYKRFGVFFENGIFTYDMKGKEGEDKIRMNFESTALLKILLDRSVVEAEKINMDYKVYGIKRDKIIDIGTVFGIDGRISIGILPADEERVACVLIGFHKEDKDISIVLKPKKVAMLSTLIMKYLIENIENELNKRLEVSKDQNISSIKDTY